MSIIVETIESVSVEVITAAVLYLASIIGLLIWPILKKPHVLINSALNAALATVIMLYELKFIGVAATLVSAVLILILSCLFSDYGR